MSLSATDLRIESYEEGPFMLFQNKEFIREAIEQGFNAKREAFLKIAYAPDCKGESPDGPFVGIDEVRHFWERYTTAFPDGRLEIQHVIAEQDWVALSYRFVGTNTGMLRGIPPTRTVLDMKGFVFSRIRDRRIIEQYFMWDNLDARRQLRHWQTVLDTEEGCFRE
jgi:predicted ester cyclase